MKVKMKQNKNTPAIRIASFSLAFLVLLFSLCFPSFASSVNGLDFSSQPIASAVDGVPGSWTGLWDVSTPVASTSSYDYRVFNRDINASKPMYAFVAPASSGNPINTIFLVSTSQNQQFYSLNKTGSTVYHQESTTSLSYTSSSGSIYYYGSISTNTFSNILVPSYNSFSDGMNDLINFIDNPPLDPHSVSFSLNPGYVAFLDVSNLSNVSCNLSTTLFSGADWSGEIAPTQRIGLVSSMPSSFSLPIAGTSIINWSGTGSKNILGQYKSFSANFTYTSVGGSSYICIVNPLSSLQGQQLTAMSSMPSSRNNPIVVSSSLVRSAKIYSLTATLAVGSGNLDIETNGETISGSADDNGDWSWTNDQTGTPVDPDTLPVGGGNDPIIGNTSINDWLQEIANSIKGFFSGAIGAVTTLVSSGSDFIHSLSGLYAWLPAPVYSVLVSALILVITIGVIKVFI